MLKRIELCIGNCLQCCKSFYVRLARGKATQLHSTRLESFLSNCQERRVSGRTCQNKRRLRKGEAGFWHLLDAQPPQRSSVLRPPSCIPSPLRHDITFQPQHFALRLSPKDSGPGFGSPFNLFKILSAGCSSAKSFQCNKL